MDFPANAVIFRYRPAAWLKVTGEDAAGYLQGQVSQELRGAESAYGLILNHKGKILADCFVVRGPGQGEFRVMSYEVAGTALKARLEEFVIADDVVIEDLTEKVEAVSLIGGGVGAWLASQERGGRFPGRRSLEENWEWVVPVAAAGDLLKPIAGAKHLLLAEIERRRILDKIPAVPRDTAPAAGGGAVPGRAEAESAALRGDVPTGDGAMSLHGSRGGGAAASPPISDGSGALLPGDLPQEVGLGDVAVAYDKGCYVGQEVMARLKTRGKVRRRLRGVRAERLPPSGAALWLGDKVVGTMRSSAGDVGLAMITGELAGGEKLALSAEGKPEIELTEG